MVSAENKLHRFFSGLSLGYWEKRYFIFSKKPCGSSFLPLRHS